MASNGHGRSPGGPAPPKSSTPVVQLTETAKRLQPCLVSLMGKVQEIERDIERRETQLVRVKDDMQEEHKQTMEQMTQWKQQQEAKFDDQRHELQQNEEAFKQRITWERGKLKRDIRIFESKRSEGNDIAHRQEPVTVEVGGEKFRTELSTLTKCEHSLFPDLVRALDRRQETDRDGRLRRDPYIFIDRDSRHFRFILNYLRQGEQVVRGGALKKADKDDLQDLLFEVQYYRLTDLERLVRRKMTSLKRPCRDFKQLMEDDHCFSKIPTPTNPTTPRAADDAKRYKFITVKEISLKGENLKGIVFDKVIFEHNISFRDCILVEAKFVECNFRGAVNLQNADLSKAKFDHCMGIDFSGRFYMDQANTNEVQFVPPLTTEDS